MNIRRNLPQFIWEFSDWELLPLKAGILTGCNRSWTNSTGFFGRTNKKGLTALERQPTLVIEKIYDWRDWINFWNRCRNKSVNKSAFAASAAT